MAQRVTDISMTVTGVREFRDALRKVDEQLANQLRGKMLAIAKSIVVDVQRKVPQLIGDARGSVKARATQIGAGVAWGSDKVPYFAWLDFGGSVGRGHRPGQAWSGSVQREWKGQPGQGRYVYPTISEHKEQTVRMLQEAIDDLALKAGFEVKG
jgi:hypothetical protein